MLSSTIRYNVDNPVGSDLVRVTVLNYLMGQLGWIENGYPLAQLIDDQNGNKIYAAYDKNFDYTSLMPDGRNGNYAFLFLRTNRIENGGTSGAGLLRTDTLELDLNIFFAFRT